MNRLIVFLILAFTFGALAVQDLHSFMKSGVTFRVQEYMKDADAYWLVIPEYMAADRMIVTPQALAKGIGSKLKGEEFTRFMTRDPDQLFTSVAEIPYLFNDEIKKRIQRFK